MLSNELYCFEQIESENLPNTFDYMARKIKSKSGQEKKLRDAARKDEKKDRPAPDEEPNPMDFGGIPNRDLKKNLGCGQG